MDDVDNYVVTNADELDIDYEKNEPIQILVYPPKNKKFRIDDKTNSIQIESMLDSEENMKMSHAVTMISSQIVPPLTDVGTLSQKCSRTSNVKEIMKIRNCFKARNCFLKGCKWSPDGFCLLSNSEDNILRLFEIPENENVTEKEILPVLVAKEGGTIYDFEWYPKMSSSDPVSCVFISTSQNAPVHLWDAYTGQLRATYQPINQYDEVTAAYSLAFSPDGSKIYSGFKKVLRIFDVSLPGRISEERKLHQKGSSVFQTNIISSISVNPVEPNLYALGSYDRTVGIYTEPEGELQCLLKGHRGGVTHIQFSYDGIRLYSGGRKDPEIICWDLRNPGKILHILKRKVDTNQRIYYDLTNDGSYLVTGSTDGYIIIYDTKTANEGNEAVLEPVETWKGHDDCVNGVTIHPFRDLLASSSGQYHSQRSSMEGDSEDDFSADDHIENSIKIWSLNVSAVNKE